MNETSQGEPLPIEWEPLPKQLWAMECPARELLYGGEKGGGKTDFLAAVWGDILDVAKQKWEATGRKQHRCRIIIFRKNLEDLKDLIVKSKELYPAMDPEMGVDGYNQNDKTWTFTSGATVAFSHLDGPTDHLGYNGHEFVGIGFDEVQQIPQEAYKFLSWQLRSKDPDYHRMRRICCTANPGGYDWIIPHFGIDKYHDGGKLLEVEVPDPDGGPPHVVTRAFIRAKLKENTHLPSDYRAQMAANMTEDEIAMYLEGDFFRVAGAFFSRLLKPGVHFVKAKPVPDTWDKIFGIDWGASAPACTLWAARDFDNRIHVFDELHRPGVTGRTYGEAMVEKYKHQKWSPGRIYRPDDFWGVIDTQAMDRYGSEATAAAGIMEWGFRIFGADKLPGERKVGINQIKERLLLDRQQQPQLVIYEDRCPQLVRALSAIPSCAPKDPEDYDMGSPYAHAIDSLRFICMKWPVRSVIEEHPVDAEVARWTRVLSQTKQTDSGSGFTTGYGD